MINGFEKVLPLGPTVRATLSFQTGAPALVVIKGVLWALDGTCWKLFLKKSLTKSLTLV